MPPAAVPSFAAAARLLSLALIAGAAAGCARSTSATPRPGTGAAASEAAPVPGQWNATLEGMNGSGVGGTALITPAASGGGTSVTLAISGATPNGSHPWHLHTGRCGEAGGSIVGTPSAYSPIAVGGDGTGQVTATLPFTVPTAGTYRLNIHKSAAEMGTVIACGNLAPM